MTTSPALARNSVPLWTLRKEASLNWLAFGLLLAAWNASYNDVPAEPTNPRPNALRGHPYVSVRAVQKVREGTKGHISVNVL